MTGTNNSQQKNEADRLMHFQDDRNLDDLAYLTEPNQHADTRTKVIRTYAKVGDMSQGLCQITGYEAYTPLLREDKIFRIANQTNALTTSPRQEVATLTVKDSEFYCPHTRLLPEVCQKAANRQTFDIEVITLGSFGDVLQAQTKYKFMRGVVTEVITLGQLFVFRFNAAEIGLEVYTYDREGTSQGTTAFSYNTQTGQWTDALPGGGGGGA